MTDEKEYSDVAIRLGAEEIDLLDADGNDIVTLDIAELLEKSGYVKEEADDDDDDDDDDKEKKD